MSWRAVGDWGTTRLRLFRIENGGVVDRVEGPGALSTDPDAVLRTALSSLMREEKPEFIHLCGMAGARAGLREAAYVDCPAGANDWRRSGLTFTFDGVPLTIAPGVAYADANGRVDVMRGEETQIFGAMRLNAALCKDAHLVVLPGTHSKWVRLEGGRIVAIQTFVTGELYALLGQSSLLAGAHARDINAENAGYQAGLARAADAGVTRALFEARAAQLRAGRSPDWAQGFVSGLLIGDEIGAMRDHIQAMSTVVVIGAPELAARYESALGCVHRMDGDACVLAGLELLDVDD